MVADAVSKPPIVSITREQYETLAVPLQVVPTQDEIFQFQVSFWVRAGLITISELAQLDRFIPQKGLFLVVPRRPYPIDYERLMKLVVMSGQQGIGSIDPQYLKDKVVVPSGPYITLDIDDGRSNLNVAPCDSEKTIISDGRSPYTAFEGICHAAVFPVLTHHSMNCVGSVCDGSYVPYVYLSGGQPGLDIDVDDIGLPDMGTPSCKERKGL